MTRTGAQRGPSRARVGLAALLGCAVVAGGCAFLDREEVPYTGRSRARLVYSEEEMAVLGNEAYAELKQKYRTVRGTAGAARVDRVGRRLARATRKNYAWEYRLFDDSEIVNAFCLPGGKIGVFTGLLPMAPGDSDMAVVLGHEMAHAVLQHSNERMSQPLLKKLVGMPTSIAVGVWGAIAPGTRKVVMNGMGVGYVVGEVLPYSQAQETEADEVGLIFMQRAGYDLSAAPRFWRRMAKEDKGRISDSVSTHPDAERRADRLEKEIQKMRGRG